MTIFADKLATLASTVRMGLSGPVEAVASALREGADRPAVAIGSGGSAIMAEYFARCRSTLGLGVTLVQSPMEFVLAANSWSDFDVWLFSAGAQNPDVSGGLVPPMDRARPQGSGIDLIDSPAVTTASHQNRDIGMPLDAFHRLSKETSLDLGNGIFVARD